MSAQIIDTVRDISSDDIVIMFIGPSDSGRSNFIDLLAGQPGRRVGHSLKSATLKIEATRVKHPLHDRRIVLVDTPGFNCTTMSDEEVLQMIGSWTRRIYENGARFSGIVYLHGVTDLRLPTGALYECLQIFRKLCDGFEKVQFFLVSTMWEEIEADFAAETESTLKRNYWAPLIKSGSKVDCLGRSESDEAWRIIDRLIEVKNSQEENGGALSDALRGLAVGSGEYSGLSSSTADEAKSPWLTKFQKAYEGLKRPKLDSEYGLPEQLTQSTFTMTPKIRLLLLVLGTTWDRNLRDSVCDLRGDDAQRIVDYFSMLLQEPAVLTKDQKSCFLSLLCTMSKSAGVYPRCSLLKDVTRATDPIAGGGFADIYKGRHKKQTICLKVVRQFSKQSSTQLMKSHLKEVTLWPQLSHQNILPFYGVYLLDEITRRIALVSPWMENGNLSQYLEEHPETSCIPLLLDVAGGLSYLHQSSVVHGDLKAVNILVSDDGRALITDFGLSFVATGSRWTTAGVGTMRWTAPELLADDSEFLRPTQEGDIWSFGCLCYEALTRKSPFWRYNERKVITILSDRRGSSDPTLPGESCDVSDGRMWSLMTRCWNYHVPQDRPPCEGIKKYIAGLGVSDNRAPASSHLWDTAAKFRKEMRKKSGAKIDHERVEEILLRMQRNYE